MKLRTDDGAATPGWGTTSAFGTFLGRYIDREMAIILTVALIPRLLFMLLVPAWIHSVDATNMKTVATVMDNGGNPYQATDLLNWPPFWMQIIFILSKMSHAYGVPFFRVLQTFLIAVEAGVMILLVRLIREIAPGSRVRAIVLTGMALNPVAIFLTCQHGHFDVLVAFWVLLFLLAFTRYNRTGEAGDWLCACLFLGLGILTKTVPLILAPMLVGGFRRSGPALRLLGAALLLGPATLGMSIIYVLSPVDVAEKVIAYRSVPGFFGISGLFQICGLGDLSWVYKLFFDLILLIALAGTAVFFWKRKMVGGREAVLYAAVLLASIPALGPGYGTQYLYWSLPLLVASYAFFEKRWRVVLGIFGIIAALTYLFQYSLVGAEGALVYNLWMIKGMRLDTMGFLTNFERPIVQVLATLPLFFAYLVMIGVGIRMLFQYAKRTEDKEAGGVQACK